MAGKEERIDREAAEDAAMARELKESEKSEEKEWGIKTDQTAFGRKKIDIPERW